MLARVKDFLVRGCVRSPPVYVGFGSMRDPGDGARMAIEAIRAQGRRVLVSRGWAGLALIDDRDDCLAVGEVNHHALRARATAVAGTMRTDGAAVAATLLAEAISRDRAVRA